MSLQPWETLSDERLCSFKVFDVRKFQRRSPRTGEDRGFFVVDTLDWVNVVAFTQARELILIRQFRHGSQQFTLEIPGGVVHEGEDSRDAALRELREESGYAGRDAVFLGEVNPNPALFTNRCATYLALDCHLEGELQQDAGEDIEVELIPWDDIDDHVRSGAIDHALVVVALHLYHLHLNT